MLESNYTLLYNTEMYKLLLQESSLKIRSNIHSDKILDSCHTFAVYLWGYL